MHLFVNTNEKNLIEDSTKMIDEGLFVTFADEGSPDCRQTAREDMGRLSGGDRLYGYVSGDGLRATGLVEEDPHMDRVPGERKIFTENPDKREWHVGVDWDLRLEDSISASRVAEIVDHPIYVRGTVVPIDDDYSPLSLLKEMRTRSTE